MSKEVNSVSFLEKYSLLITQYNILKVAHNTLRKQRHILLESSLVNVRKYVTESVVFCAVIGSLTSQLLVD